MSTRSRALVATIVACALVLAPVAGARRLVLRDPPDTRGPLDVRRVHKLGKERPMWKIVTGRRWRVNNIFERGYVLVYLDTFGSARPDYYALVGSNGARMQATLYRDRARQSDYRVGRLDAWRRDRRSLSVRIPLRWLLVGERRAVYRWYVQTLMTSRRCPRVCFDRVPDRGAVEEPLRDRGPAISAGG